MAAVAEITTVAVTIPMWIFSFIHDGFSAAAVRTGTGPFNVVDES
jgi:hypothetical protein